METTIASLLPAFNRLQLIYVALRVGLIARLGIGPGGSDELSISVGIPERRLVRLLRGLVWAEVLEIEGADRYRLGDDARVLLDDAPTSLASSILFQGRFFYSAWGHLFDYVSEGVIPFKAAHGASLFELIGADSSLSAVFNSPMAVRTTEYSLTVAKLRLLRDAHVIVDVAGGEGRLLADLLIENPAAHGIIFDLASAAGQAENLIATMDLTERCRFHSGDMFSDVPAGGDVYLLKWVLHDWDDESAVQILRNVRRVMSRDVALVIIERLIPEPINASSPLIQADLNMLVLNGGAERTAAQYNLLLIQADLCLQEVKPLESYYGFHALIARIPK